MIVACPSYISELIEGGSDGVIVSTTVVVWDAVTVLGPRSEKLPLGVSELIVTESTFVTMVTPFTVVEVELWGLTTAVPEN